MKRQERYQDWTTVPLMDLPTEDIEPVNVSPDVDGVEVPHPARELFFRVQNWVTEIYKRTKDTQEEHGFYIDWYGNVIGIVSGDYNEIMWPRDNIASRIILFHTHPGGAPALSNSDLETFDSIHDQGAQVLITVPDKGYGSMYYFRRSDVSNVRGSSPNVSTELVQKYAGSVSNAVLGTTTSGLRDTALGNITMLRNQLENLQDLHLYINNMETNEGNTLVYDSKPIMSDDIK